MLADIFAVFIKKGHEDKSVLNNKQATPSEQ